MLHDFVLNLFQFHKGPIKAKYAAILVVFRVLFQFHKGPIKALCQR